jgi:hypothetical protein
VRAPRRDDGVYETVIVSPRRSAQRAGEPNRDKAVDELNSMDSLSALRQP